MKSLTKKGVGIVLALLLLSSCSLLSKEDVEVSSISQATHLLPETQAESSEFPPELLEWVAQSGWDIAPELIARHTMPVADEVVADYPESYLVETKHHLYERQSGNSCGGHASAYLLRTLGKDVSGQEAYDGMEYKITDGLVLPQGLLDYLADQGYPATLYQGDFEQLKTRLSAGGKPVIVLVGSGMEYQHYIALLGYDADSFYFFDSNRPENPDAIYNAVLTNEEFAPLWENIIPGFERIYIAVD